MDKSNHECNMRVMSDEQAHGTERVAQFSAFAACPCWAQVLHHQASPERAPTNTRISWAGTYTGEQRPESYAEGQADSVAWDPTKHNMGMAFDRAFWNDLKVCGAVHVLPRLTARVSEGRSI